MPCTRPTSFRVEIHQKFIFALKEQKLYEEETLKVQTALSFTLKSLPSLFAVELKNDANQSALSKTNLSRQLLRRQWSWVISFNFIILGWRLD